MLYLEVFMKMALSLGLILTVTCWFLPLGYAQNLLNRPESVEFDFHSDCYFVSNWGDGNIIQIDNSGHQIIFHSGFTRLAGLYKYGNILYAASNLDPFVGVYGLNVGTGEVVAEIPIPGTGLLNDITSDTSGNLYVTDFYDSKIYKIRISDYSVSLFVDSHLGNPNGIVFDKPHNRLLTACQSDPGRPIRAISLQDSSVSILVYTYLSGVDGLTFDNENRLYFSSWETNSVYRYDPEYTDEPELVSDGYSGPADIFINRLSNILCIPDFYNDSVAFVQIDPSAIGGDILPGSPFVTSNYPNPFNGQTIIKYNLPKQCDIALEIYDILGRKIESLEKPNQPAGLGQITWDASGKPSGVYFYRLGAGNEQKTGRMVLLK